MSDNYYSQVPAIALEELSKLEKLGKEERSVKIRNA
jgi:hypothetical protein